MAFIDCYSQSNFEGSQNIYYEDMSDITENGAVMSAKVKFGTVEVYQRKAYKGTRAILPVGDYNSNDAFPTGFASLKVKSFTCYSQSNFGGYKNIYYKDMPDITANGAVVSAKVEFGTVEVYQLKDYRGTRAILPVGSYAALPQEVIATEAITCYSENNFGGYQNIYHKDMPDIIENGAVMSAKVEFGTVEVCQLKEDYIGTRAILPVGDYKSNDAFPTGFASLKVVSPFTCYSESNFGGYQNIYYKDMSDITENGAVMSAKVEFGTVEVYQLKDYRGTQAILLVGDYKSYVQGVIASLKVIEAITCYSENNFGGYHNIYYKDMPDITENGAVMSAKVEFGTVEVYQLKDYRGTRAILPVGDYISNDAFPTGFASLKVVSPFTCYSESNFEGYQNIYYKDMSDITENGAVMSAKVEFGTVEVYQRKAYRGTRANLPVGDYKRNDAFPTGFASLKVVKPFTCYSQSNFGGYQNIYYKDMPDITDNGAIMSAKVEFGTVEVYQLKDYRGTRAILLVGDYISNDAFPTGFASLKVVSPFTCYSESNFEGYQNIYYKDMSDITENGAVMSAKVKFGTVEVYQRKAYRGTRAILPVGDYKSNDAFPTGFASLKVVKPFTCYSQSNFGGYQNIYYKDMPDITANGAVMSAKVEFGTVEVYQLKDYRGTRAILPVGSYAALPQEVIATEAITCYSENNFGGYQNIYHKDMPDIIENGAVMSAKVEFGTVEVCQLKEDYIGTRAILPVGDYKSNDAFPTGFASLKVVSPFTCYSESNFEGYQNIYYKDMSDITENGAVMSAKVEFGTVEVYQRKAYRGTRAILPVGDYKSNDAFPTGFASLKVVKPFTCYSQSNFGGYQNIYYKDMPDITANGAVMSAKVEFGTVEVYQLKDYRGTRAILPFGSYAALPQEVIATEAITCYSENNFGGYQNIYHKDMPDIIENGAVMSAKVEFGTVEVCQLKEDYIGTRAILPVGDYKSNDAFPTGFASLKVVKPFTCYSQSNFGGYLNIYYKDMPDITANGAVMSAKVEFGTVEVYQLKDYGGTCVILPVGHYQSIDAFPEGVIASLKVIV